MARARTALLFAIAAFLLRACAIFAGPGFASHYHPDASKQVRAVEQFLRDDYLVIQHRHNYDGYPLFNSHLVEYVIRASRPGLQALRRYLGATTSDMVSPIPDPTSIAAVMLLWNALLSSAAVAIAVLLGRRFGRIAGLLAGALAAVSPLDIAAAHFPVNDTAAAFFALLAVYFAVRIVETAGVRFYIVAALATAAAFSSKYNGAASGAALVLAHFLRYRGLQAATSGAAWRRLGAGAAALVLGIALTSPALLINPHWTIESIRSFISWISTYGLTKAEMQMPFGERLVWSLRSNGKLLLHVTGLLALAGTAAALVKARPRNLAWVIFSLPAAHALISIAAKPMEHPTHQLPAVLPLLVLSAAGMGWLMMRERPLLARIAGTVLAAGAMLSMAIDARNELFFFSHSDTRQIAAAWAGDAVPPSVKIDAGRTFAQPSQAAEQGGGSVEFLTPKFHRRPRGREFLLARFSLEQESLPVFRNPDVEVLASAPALLAPSFSLPCWQPVPSLSSNNLVFIETPVFSRSPLVRDVHDETSFAVTAVTRQPLHRAWLVLRAGAAPARLTAGFAGASTSRLLAPGEVAVFPVERPREQRPPYEGNHFYRWTAEAHFGRVRIALVTAETTLGRYLFNAGLFAGAATAFRLAVERRLPAGPRLEQAIAAMASGSLSAAEAEELAADLLSVSHWTGQEIRQRFGIHPDWIEGIPTVTLTQADFSQALIAARDGEPDPVSPLPSASTLPAAPILLEPGSYLLEIGGDRWDGAIRVELRDACGRISWQSVIAPPAGECSSGVRQLPLDIPSRAAAGSLTLLPEAGGKLPNALHVNMRPDVLGAVQGRLDLLRRLLGKSAATAPHPHDAGAFVAAGDQALKRGEREAAAALFRLAATADPDCREARVRLGELPAPLPLVPARVRFRNGIELVASRLETARLRPGESVGLVMNWKVPEGLARIDRLAVWVHAVDGGGHIAFQGDHSILDDLGAGAADGRGVACVPRVKVPPETPAGTYELRAGIWIPNQGKKIPLLGNAALPHSRHGVVLGTLTVAAGDPETAGDVH